MPGKARRRRMHRECIVYDADMRTTVDLPPAVHRRAARMAAERNSSLSAVLSELVTRGLAQLDAPVEVSMDPQTQLPVLSLGRKVTSADVAEALDD